MSILMVKKILEDGSPCAKCAQAEEILRKRGLWERIDRVIEADSLNRDSECMRLAARHNVELLPFFIVTPKDAPEESNSPRIYTRVFEFIRKELAAPKAAALTAADSFNIEEANARSASMKPRDILGMAQEAFGSNLVLAFSGAEDVVLIHMASLNALPFSVICLDTGRLHEETLGFLDTVREKYSVDIEVFTPSHTLLEPFVREKGLYSFYKDGHRECCGIRKVEPLGRALTGREAWATGLRRDQSPATRSSLNHVEADEAHLSPSGRPLVKINPVLDWDAHKVWGYIRAEGIPYNPLHNQGYRSIGCAPCTRPSRPGEHERDARWWWEKDTHRECGLHLR